MEELLFELATSGMQITLGTVTGLQVDVKHPEGDLYLRTEIAEGDILSDLEMMCYNALTEVKRRSSVS